MKEDDVNNILEDNSVVKNLGRILTQPLIRKKCKPPKGTKCSECGSENVSLYRALVDHWASGLLKCNECNNIETVQHHLIKNIVTVEPLDE